MLMLCVGGDYFFIIDPSILLSTHTDPLYGILISILKFHTHTHTPKPRNIESIKKQTETNNKH